MTIFIDEDGSIDGLICPDCWWPICACLCDNEPEEDEEK